MTFKKTIHAVDTHGGTPMRVGTGGRRSPGRWIARAGQPCPRRVHRGASMASPRSRRTIWPGAARLRHSAVRLPPPLSSSEGWGGWGHIDSGRDKGLGQRRAKRRKQRRIHNPGWNCPASGVSGGPRWH